jgi:hypothetical protein
MPENSEGQLADTIRYGLAYSRMELSCVLDTFVLHDVNGKDPTNIS